MGVWLAALQKERERERVRAIAMPGRDIRDRSRSVARGERKALMARLSSEPAAFSRASMEMRDDKEVAMRAVTLQALGRKFVGCGILTAGAGFGGKKLMSTSL